MAAYIKTREIRDTRDIDDVKKYTEQQKYKNMEKTSNPTYKIFNIKDLLAELNFEGRAKGSKTEVYLEGVIKRINETSNYRWVQFFQLVDVFFIIVEVKPKEESKPKPVKRDTFEEIKQHYNPEQPQFNKPVEKKEPEPEPAAIEYHPRKEDYVKKNMNKPELPWAKK